MCAKSGIWGGQKSFDVRGQHHSYSKRAGTHPIPLVANFQLHDMKLVALLSSKMA